MRGVVQADRALRQEGADERLGTSCGLVRTLAAVCAGHLADDATVLCPADTDA
ncbi:hypothetical protein ACFWIJ_45460 [Streptomyces sp. NPDC127079]|uniref:hypothetical protein n=1 Tax=Streptomyces sp. NPDC127079 TaxID=3347132 RepID=UPI003661C4ED